MYEVLFCFSYNITLRRTESSGDDFNLSEFLKHKKHEHDKIIIFYISWEWQLSEIWLIFRIYKGYKIPQIQRLSPKFGVWDQEAVPDEEIQLVNKYIKKMVNIIVQSRDTMYNNTDIHLIPGRMVIIKKSTNNKCLRGCGKKEILLHGW